MISWIFGSGKKGERGIVGEAAHRGYLDRHPYKEYEKPDLEAAKWVHSFIYSFTHLLIYVLLIYSFMFYSFTHIFIYSFTHLFIYSFIYLLIY